MRFGLLIWVGMALPATAAEQVPALVNLPKLQPLTPTEVTIKAEPAARAAEATDRLALLDLKVGARVDAAFARRLSTSLLEQLKAAGRYSQVIHPGTMGGQLPLSAQERLVDCSTPTCLVDLGAELQVSAVVTPHITLEQDGFRLALDYMDLGVEARWRRELKGRTTEADLMAGVPLLVKSLWGGKLAPSAVAAGSAAKPRLVKDSDWMRWTSAVVGLGGVGLFGGSYMVMRDAQEEFEPATATAKDYDQLSDAQTRARLMWGAGLTLAGAGVAGFGWLGR